MDLNLRFFFFLPRWKMWFLGAERGEVRLGGGRRQAKEEICSEASFCQQEDLGLTWGKHLDQRPGSAAWRGFPSPPLWHEGCVGCEGSQIEPRSRGRGGAQGPARTPLGLWTTAENLFFLNLDCCLHKLVVLHGVCAFSPLCNLFQLWQQKFV